MSFRLVAGFAENSSGKVASHPKSATYRVKPAVTSYPSGVPTESARLLQDVPNEPTTELPPAPSGLLMR